MVLHTQKKKKTVYFYYSWAGAKFKKTNKTVFVFLIKKLQDAAA